MGIRDERKAATQREIQLAALDLVEAHGLAALTVGKIAERVGIAERTFFRYFESKEAALLPAERWLVESLCAQEFEPSADGAHIFRVLVKVCRENFLEEMREQRFRRVSRLLLVEPDMLAITSRHEQRIVSAVSQSLVERDLVPPMQAQLIGEMLSVTWRVAWQSFGREEQAGRETTPVELFEKAVAELSVLVGAPIE